MTNEFAHFSQKNTSENIWTSVPVWHFWLHYRGHLHRKPQVWKFSSKFLGSYVGTSLINYQQEHLHLSCLFFSIVRKKSYLFLVCRQPCRSFPTLRPFSNVHHNSSLTLLFCMCIVEVLYREIALLLRELQSQTGEIAFNNERRVMLRRGNDNWIFGVAYGSREAFP